MGSNGFKRSRQRNDDLLARMDPLAFERLIAEHYRGQGWQVEHSGTGGSGRKFDGGIDLKLRRGDEYLVVECKRWNAYQVPHNDVHELLGIMLTEGATGAVFVCSGEFTPHARKSAGRDGRIQLIDGVELRRMLAPALAQLADAERDAVAPQDGTLDPMHALLSRGTARTFRQKTDASSSVEWERVGRSGTRGRQKPTSVLAFTLMLLALVAINWQRCSKPPPAQQARAATPQTSSAASGFDRAAPLQMVPVEMQPIPEPPPFRRPTAAEARESQRRADEAMRLIEAHTPEI